MWTIRTAAPGDIEALAALHVRVWRATYAHLAPRAAWEALDEARRRDHWTDLLSRGPTSSTLVAATTDGTLVAFGHAGPASHPALAGAGEIVHLYVRGDRQRSGVGRALLGRLAAFLVEQGHTVVRLAVVSGNEQAIAFYERHGGRRVGEYVDGVLWRSANLVYEWTDPAVLIR